MMQQMTSSMPVRHVVLRGLVLPEQNSPRFR
jgi:hypothetical protein